MQKQRVALPTGVYAALLARGSVGSTGKVLDKPMRYAERMTRAGRSADYLRKPNVVKSQRKAPA